MKKLIRGENDLLTLCPNIAKEWNYEKNEDLKPSDVLPGSHKKVWWKCQKGHEWEAIIRERSGGKPCLYCSNHKLLPGFNDLATVHPEVANEWNYEKNGDLQPEEVKYSANIQVWWKCKDGHEWQAYVFNRIKGSGCPYCSNVKVLTGYNDLATTHPELAKEWNYERNGNLKPTDVLYGSHKKVWWKCKNGHEWEAEIKDRGSSGQSCPYCSNKRVLKGYNDLYTYCVNNNRQDLIEEFDKDKNGFSMTDITIGSSKEIWWKCTKGHSYKATASRRRNGTGCGICSHNVLLKNYNDLLTTHPEIAKEWDYEKNAKGPDEVMAGSNNEKYWFICPKGHSYLTTLLNRKKGTGCSICAMEKHTSFPEKAIFFYIKQYVNDVKENYRCSFLGRKEIDIFLPELNIGIEYDGVAWHKDIKRDLDKDKECIKNGITLIRIRENGCDDYNSDSVKKYIPPYDMLALGESIIFIFNYLNQMFDLNIAADVDVDRDRVSILEQIDFSEKENSIASFCPDIKKYWDYDKNGKIAPEQIPHSSEKKVFLKCEIGHEWEVKARDFPSHPWCPYCSGRRALPGFNDLFTTNPELIPFWSKNNRIDPTKIKSGCNSRALWYCPNCGGEYDMRVVDKVKAYGCPYCSGRRVLKGYNDLATLVPELVQDWNYEKNFPLKPDEVTKGSSKKVWWKCHLCNHDWKTDIYTRAVLNRPCPECRKATSINQNAKQVIQLSLDGMVINEFVSAAEAERQTGIKGISKACRNEKPTAGGYKWKYKQ